MRLNQVGGHVTRKHVIPRRFVPWNPYDVAPYVRTVIGIHYIKINPNSRDKLFVFNLDEASILESNSISLDHGG